MPSDKNSNNLSKQGVGVFGALVAGQLGQQVFFNGLQKANEDFLKAIIRYSEFEELHFFLEASELEVQKAHWQPYIEEHGSNKEVLFISVGLLPDYLANQIYQVFHKGDPYIAELAGLRNSCSKVFFPITGRAHTLSTDSNLSKSRDLILSDIKKCDAILCSSEPQRQVMENLLLSASQSISEYTGASLSYRGKLSLLPLGIEADSQRAHDKGEARKQLGYAPDQFVLLSIGRFSPSDKMDLHPLLLAANELLEEKNITNFILILAGDGDAAGDYVKSLLQQLYELNLERRVRFELSIDEEQKALLFEAADAYISLADNVQESFGLAPIEAMNYSVPVILSDWNGYKELIENEKSGFLIETVSSDHDLLTRAINPLHPGLAHLIEAQGSAINIDSLVEKLELLIRDSALCEQLGYK